MTRIRYQRDLAGIEWDAMKAILAADDFDNGRSAEQLHRSFAASAYTVIALDGAQIVGTARVLSDGVCNAYVVDVWTLSSYRRRAIASTMMRLLLADLPGQHVAIFTDEAPEFYESLGMRRRGVTFETVVGHWLEGADKG